MRLLVYKSPAQSPKPLVFEIPSTLLNLAYALYPPVDAQHRVRFNERGKYRYTPSKEYIHFISNLKLKQNGNTRQKSSKKGS